MYVTVFPCFSRCLNRVIRDTALWLAVLAAAPFSCHAALQLTALNDLYQEEVVLSFHLDPGDIRLSRPGNPVEDETVLSIEGASSTRPDGEYCLPVLGRLIRVSEQKTPVLEYSIEDAVYIDLPAPIRISDGSEHTESLLTAQSVTPNMIRESVAGHAESIPGQGTFAELGTPAVMRDLRVVHLTIRPVIPVGTHRVLAVTRARITVRMTSGDVINPLDRPVNITHSFDSFYAATVVNYTRGQYNRDGEPEHYLIFTPDEYEARLQSFIAWKEAEGFSVDICRKSDLPAYPNPNDLKSLLLSFYTSPTPPAYILFCGDESATPIYYSYDETHPPEYADDLYYSLLDGTDILPDVFLGRLPAENAQELSVMLSKILHYELNPPVNDPSFWKTALMAASALEESQVTTKEQTADRLSEYCGYDTIHKFYDWDDGTADLVMDVIDQGVSIINYRGEGWRKGWNPLHLYWFDYNHVYALENFNRTPYITSIGCGVCLFDTADDCFGHALLATGTTTSPRGAVGIIGPTWNTHTTYNNWQDRGMYRGYVYWNVCRSTPIMDYGKLYMLDQFPEPYHEPYLDVQFRSYLNFGTPDMWVRMGTPRTISPGLAYAVDSNDVFIAIRDSLGNICDNALISFAADGHRWVLPTDEDGGVLTNLSTVTDGELSVVITGENLIPLQTTLPWRGPGNTGDLIITEVKPDIETTGFSGDKVEIFNQGATAVDLRGWILGDLDHYDTPFVSGTATLQPLQIAVVEFAGPLNIELVTSQPYGLYIRSQSIPDFSSLEDVIVLRDPMGTVVDSLAWHDMSGIGSTNVAGDLARVTGPTSTLTVAAGGWWDAPDNVTQEQYENYSIDWSPFAGNGGAGSIQRCNVSATDGPGNFTIQIQTGFGSFYHPFVMEAPPAVHGERLNPLP